MDEPVGIAESHSRIFAEPESVGRPISQFCGHPKKQAVRNPAIPATRHWFVMVAMLPSSFVSSTVNFSL